MVAGGSGGAVEEAVQPNINVCVREIEADRETA